MQPTEATTSGELSRRSLVGRVILRAHFDGDPWVEEESPISSIDPRVTWAVVASEAATPALELNHHGGGER